ncbi:MAG: hypothetical protein C4518_11065 [Desulfobacteraceae bacterium]|nr:MAG: hypothetical protein C4518_11065 [Desulfobacteraceae bacterium]
MHKYLKTMGMVLATLCLWTGIVHADITITKNEAGSEEVTYYQSKKIATFSDNMIQIIDAGSGKIKGVDLKSKTYYETTLKEYKTAMVDFMKRMMDMQIQIIMSSTGQTREQAEASLKNPGNSTAKGGQTVKIEKGATKDIAGYSSDEYLILAGGRVVQEIWVSPAVDKIITQSIGASEKKDLDKLIGEIEAEINLALNMPGMDTEIANAETRIMEKGYVMKQVDREMGMPMSPEEEMNINISTKPIDSSKFSVPSGYQKISMAEYLEKTMMSGMGEDEE